MTEIIPGIYQFEIPIPNNPLGHTNTYLVQGNNEYLLIDPGMNTKVAFDSLRRELSEKGIGFEAITRIVATHVHGDHYGLVGKVKQLSRSTVLLHQLDRDLIQSMYQDTENRMQQQEQWLRRNGVPGFDPSEFQMFAHRMPGTMAPTMPDIILHGGETISIGIFNLQVLWTPGHSPGHICLYEPARKILFSGDHVLPVITPNISLGLQPKDGVNPLADFINSLNMLRQLDVRLVLPAHEKPFNGLQTRIDEIIWHHERRSAEILETLKAEPKTAYQISTGVTWMLDMGGVRFQDLAPWDKRMAVSETLAHLEAMRVDGKVNRLPADDVIYYQHI